MGEHAKIGPSSLHRLLACPGSFRLSSGVPEGAPSQYAAEGTVAHTICEECLGHGSRNASYYLGHEMEADGFTFTVDEEMVEGCTLYIEHCRSLIPTTKGSLWEVETRVDLKDLWSPDTPPEECFGTADFIAWDTKRSHLAVCDFKYGRGDVDPEDNPQAQAYALGTILTYQVLPREVDIYVVQPRAMTAKGIKHWRTTGLDLLRWGREVLKPGVAKLMQPDAHLLPGAHCKFCPALARCPAMKKLAQDTSREVFDPVPPSPAGLSDQELSVILDRAEIIRPWLDAVRAEASTRLDKGVHVPGWKLVPKRAMRKWADPRGVERLAESEDFGDVIFKRALETPTQIEKKDPSVYARLDEAGLIDKGSSGTTLVRDDDPRKAVIGNRARDVFEKSVD